MEIKNIRSSGLLSKVSSSERILMFYSYNTQKLGLELKKIRNSLNLSQEKVTEITKVNRNTIRRIEKGSVIPRFDTLVQLSKAYKQDLVSIMRYLAPTYELFRYYNDIDKLILNNDTEQLNSLYESLNNVLQSIDYTELVNIDEINQLKGLTKTISLFNSNKMNEALQEIVLTIKITNPLFKVTNFQCCTFSLLERRILLMMAVIYVRLDNLVLSNQLLMHISSIDNNIYYKDTEGKKIYLKILLNISYNAHRLSDNVLAIDYANLGIEFCNENSLSYLLPHFLFRKGMAQYFMEQGNYLVTLQNSIRLFSILGFNELAVNQKKSLFDNYGITI